jgi:hypothetical protein
VFLVFKNYNPLAHWAVYDRKPKAGIDVDYHSVGITFGPGTPHPIVYVVIGTLTRHILKGEARWRRPDALLNMLLLNVGDALGGPPQVHGDSVLAPFLLVSAPSLDDETRRPPILHLSASEDLIQPPQLDQVGEEMVLAMDLGAELDEPGLLTPLPLGTVGLVLGSLGFQPENGKSVADTLTLDDASLISAKAGAVVTTSVVDGKLRALLVEPIDPTPSQWEALNSTFRALARDLGARFGPQDG